MVIELAKMNKAELIQHLNQSDPELKQIDEQLRQFVDLLTQAGVDYVQASVTVEEVKREVVQLVNTKLDAKFTKEELITLCEWTSDALSKKNAEYSRALDEALKDVVNEAIRDVTQGDDDDLFVEQYEPAPDKPLSEMTLEELAAKSVSYAEDSIRSFAEKIEMELAQQVMMGIMTGQVPPEALGIPAAVADVVVDRSLAKACTVAAQVFNREEIVESINRQESEIGRKQREMKLEILGAAQEVGERVFGRLAEEFGDGSEGGE